MGAHLIEGQFQSDKYPTTPPGKVPLSVKDPTAQDLLWEYARRRRAVDAEFSDDLEEALRAAGYVPAEESAPRPVDLVRAKIVLDGNRWHLSVDFGHQVGCSGSHHHPATPQWTAYAATLTKNDEQLVNAHWTVFAGGAAGALFTSTSSERPAGIEQAAQELSVIVNFARLARGERLTVQSSTPASP